ncbi:MAG TPA: hypothetical protein VII53_05480 [Solirubrobacteraceae bacterium]
MRMSSLPLRACRQALARVLGVLPCAVLATLSMCVFAAAAPAEQISYQQVTPVGPYDSSPHYLGAYYSEPFGPETADYVTPDGSSVFFSSEGPFPGLPATGGRVDVFRASRTPGGGWSTTWMSPGPDTLYGESKHDRIFEAASTDGTKVIFESRDQLDPSRYECGINEQGANSACALRVYEYDSTTGRTTLVSRSETQTETLYDAFFASASPDLGTVSWLTPQAMTAGVEDHNSVDVYSTSAGVSALVSAQSSSTGSVSANQLLWEAERGEYWRQLGGPYQPGELAQVPTRNAHLVSADGSEQFFQDVRQLTDGAPGPGLENVYMRRGTTTTLISSTAQRTLATTVPPSNSFFGDATPDGRDVFFETSSQLTNGDNNETVDVYRYDVSTNTVSLVSAIGNTESSLTTGTGTYFVTASADASHVYIASRDDLDPSSAPAGNAWKLYQRAEGRTRFIALYPELEDLSGDTERGSAQCAGVLTSIANEDGTRGFPRGGCDQVATMRTTADGSKLLFESAQPLTPGAARGLKCLTDSTEGNFVNSDEQLVGTGNTPGTGCNIYLYDDATQTIALLSSGATGYGAFLSRLRMPDTAGEQYWTAPLGQPLLMSSNGEQVFFSSRDALTPGAITGLLNIYRWDGGTLTLVSPSSETSDSYYGGNTTDGSQVFFSSRQSLIPDSENHGQLAIYDAQLGALPATGASDPPGTPQPLAVAPTLTLSVAAPDVISATARPATYVPSHGHASPAKHCHQKAHHKHVRCARPHKRAPAQGGRHHGARVTRRSGAAR